MAGEAKPTPLQRAAQSVAERVMLLQALMAGKPLALAPPAGGRAGAWTTLEASGDPALVEVRERLGKAWRANDQAALDAAGAALRKAAHARNAAALPEEWRLRLEVAYLQWHPFRAAWVCCALAAFALAMSRSGARGLGYRSGRVLSVLAILFQAAAVAVLATLIPLAFIRRRQASAAATPAVE